MTGQDEHDPMRTGKHHFTVVKKKTFLSRATFALFGRIGWLLEKPGPAEIIIWISVDTFWNVSMTTMNGMATNENDKGFFILSILMMLTKTCMTHEWLRVCVCV